MLFSDNVPLEKEIALKRFAAKRGLLVMGPDCGTAIINGVPLAFANAVSRGSIGIVAAAGTGLQEVSCLISNAGAGISQAIGTGGRDVKQEVGGIMFIEALKALARDEQTRVILLVSKPPHPQVLRRIERVHEDDPQAGGHDVHRRAEQGRSTGDTGRGGAAGGGAGAGQEARTPRRDSWLRATRSLRKLAQREARAQEEGPEIRARAVQRRHVLRRGADHSQRHAGGVYSNAPVQGVKQLRNSLVSQKNTLIDLGEDEFTVGRPHPMIDYSLRNRRILEEAADPETAVILLDVVLGYGSNPDPAAELARRDPPGGAEGRRWCAASRARTGIRRTGAGWRRRCERRARS